MQFLIISTTEIFTADSLISFLILSILEIVLGIDNVIFVSIILNRLHKDSRKKARRVWMITGILSRCLLLMALSWLLAQKGKHIIPESWFGKGLDLASIVMLVGGLFLIYKSVKEIHHKLEGENPSEATQNQKQLSFGQAIGQILVIDAVFSFDSVITAGGTAKHIEIMIAAVIVAMFVMFTFSARISDFIQNHPTIKMLALSFLVMIGVSLIVEGWNSEMAHELHLKNYIYFAMAFSFIVELLNLFMRKKQQRQHVVHLNGPELPKDENQG
ncbi:TerC family protein [Niabella hirudinis]|uniref:TerC family protein n=1 Tax=Niabella hirudinis TaxID=1285929 RepID=UPI003EC04D63